MRLPYDVRANIVQKDTQTAFTLIDAVASGRKRMQLICSAGGMGKTSVGKQRTPQGGACRADRTECRRQMRRVLEKHELPFAPDKKVAPGAAALAKGIGLHIVPDQMKASVDEPDPVPLFRIFIEAKPQQAISLVRVLYECAVLNAKCLLFDDPGKIAADPDCCDVMKTAFGDQRTVSFAPPEITRNERWREEGHRSYSPYISPPDFPVPPDLGWLWFANSNYTDPEFLAKLGNDFEPLISRGLDPFWIRDDREHDFHDLFLYVHHQATENNLLRNMGFPYQVSRAAINFYITHANHAWPQNVLPSFPHSIHL